MSDIHLLTHISHMINKLSIMLGSFVIRSAKLTRSFGELSQYVNKNRMRANASCEFVSYILVYILV